MNTTTIVGNARYTRRLTQKRVNLEQQLKRKAERDCFWTWPLGHVRRSWIADSIKARTTEGEISVRVLVSVCSSCDNQTRNAVSDSGHVQIGLKRLIDSLHIPLPE